MPQKSWFCLQVSSNSLQHLHNLCYVIYQLRLSEQLLILVCSPELLETKRRIHPIYIAVEVQLLGILFPRLILGF